MDVIQSFLLGLLQGLTEFLPISSSGHLALARYFIGENVQTGIVFEVFVHFGTLCSIVLYYRNEVTQIIKAIPGWLRRPVRSKDDHERMIGFILISMIPAFIVGFTLEEYFEAMFLNPVVVSIMLLVTGTILFCTRFVKSHEGDLNGSKSFIIGLAQAFAIIPGISRSGSTISMGLYLGLKREEVANFSFLMVIPVIGGATFLKVLTLAGEGANAASIINLAVGFFTAFISGYFALKYLILVLKKKGFHYFAYYCWALGSGMLIYLFLPLI